MRDHGLTHHASRLSPWALLFHFECSRLTPMEWPLLTRVHKL
jgi:hypothetical protein